MSEQPELRRMRVRVLIEDLRAIHHDLTDKAADALSLMQAELDLALATNDYLRKQVERTEATS